MEKKEPKYSINDIIKLKEDETFKKIIIYICHSFYDKDGFAKEVYYYTRHIDNDTYPPLPIKESSIDKYYTKL